MTAQFTVQEFIAGAWFNVTRKGATATFGTLDQAEEFARRFKLARVTSGKDEVSRFKNGERR